MEAISTHTKSKLHSLLVYPYYNTIDRPQIRLLFRKAGDDIGDAIRVQS